MTRPVRADQCSTSFRWMAERAGVRDRLRNREPQPDSCADNAPAKTSPKIQARQLVLTQRTRTPPCDIDLSREEKVESRDVIHSRKLPLFVPTK